MGAAFGMGWLRLAVTAVTVAALGAIGITPTSARPTDKHPPGEPSYGKIDEQKPLCRKAPGGELCVHWVASGPQRAKRAQATATIGAFLSAWKTEVGGLGYRAPLPDKTGAAGRHRSAIDVYLADIGAGGTTLGQCKPTAPKRSKHSGAGASAYCIVENDFKGFASDDSIGVTAAHEFFHAVQYAYDASKAMPLWLAEGTAVWMQSQVVSSAQSDQFLQQSPLTDPQVPLDASDPYGASIFWQYVSEAIGAGAIRAVWDSTAAGVPSSASILAMIAQAGGTTVATLMNRFAAWNYELDAPWSYRRGTAYLAMLQAGPPADASYNLLPSHSQAGPRTIDVANLAAGYVKFRNATAGMCAITVSTGSPADASLIMEPVGAGAATLSSVPGSGTATVEAGPGASLVLVLTNPGASATAMTYRVETSCI